MSTWWSRVGWMWTFYALAVADAVITVTGWAGWDWEHRLISCAFLILAVLVSEEWFLPGGFHVQYNTLMRSDRLDRYPMSRLTVSIPVVAAMALGLLIIPFGGHVLALAMGTFASAEVLGHSVMGTIMLRRLAPAGKRTIYGPGAVTAYGLFLPLAVAAFAVVASSGATLGTWLAGAAVGLVYAGVTALVPEFALRSRESAFPYTGAGYYERFSKSGLV